MAKKTENKSDDGLNLGDLGLNEILSAPIAAPASQDTLPPIMGKAITPPKDPEDEEDGEDEDEPEDKAAVGLSAKEKRTIEKEVRAEIAKEAKAKMAAEYRASIKSELKQKQLFQAGKDAEGEDVHEIRIELAKFSLYLMLDGKVYYHGHTYKFTGKQAAVVKDQMYRTWLHDSEIHGLDINEMNGRRQYLTNLSGR